MDRSPLRPEGAQANAAGRHGLQTVSAGIGSEHGLKAVAPAPSIRGRPRLVQKSRLVRRRRGGWSLIEIVITVGIVAAMGLMVSEVFITVMHTFRRTGEADAAGLRLDAALGRLLADAWGASKIEVADEATLRLTIPGVGVATWTRDAEGLSRSLDKMEAPGAAATQPVPETWKLNGQHASFRAHGRAAVLIIPATNMTASHETLITSQLKAGGAR